MAPKKKINKIPSIRDLQKAFPTTFMASSLDESKLPWLPSRFLAFNYVLGGGIPYGKILEIFGEESSGKSLMSYDFAYCAQYLGGIVLWVDAEQSFTNDWAKENGLDLDRVMLLKETSIERISDWIAQATLYWRSILVHNEPILLVLDSMAALDTEANIDSEMSSASADMGNRAKAIYKMFRIRNEQLYQLGVTQIYINQLRKNLKAGMFENPDTTPGGAALKFYASQRIGFYGGKSITKKVGSKERKLGKVTSIRTIKNKVAPPRETIKGAPIYNNPKYHEVGFDRYYNLLDVFIDNDILIKAPSGSIKKKGEEEILCRGEEKFQSLMENNPELRRELLALAGINTLGKTKKKLAKLGENLFPIEGVVIEEDSNSEEDER